MSNKNTKELLDLLDKLGRDIPFYCVRIKDLLSTEDDVDERKRILLFLIDIYPKVSKLSNEIHDKYNEFI